MKKLILKTDVVAQLSSLKRVVGGNDSDAEDSCRYGICITPKLTTWLDDRDPPVGPPVLLTDGAITCRDSGPNTNATMVSCRYGCL